MKQNKPKSGFTRLFWREVALVAKDHSLLLTLLIAPLLYAFFYGSIYINKEEEHVQLAVVDDDNTTLSRLLMQNIDKSQIVDLVHFPNLGEAKEYMYQGNCQGYFYIPKDTEKSLYTLKQANVVLAVNAARFLPSSDLLANVQQICLTIGAGVRLKYFQQTQGLTNEAAMQQVAPVSLDYRPLFNERSSYGGFLLPGLLALILQQTLLIGLSESVAAERERKSVLLWNTGNLSQAIWGKGLFYLMLFGCYAFFFLNINFHLLNIPMRGSGFQLGLLFFLLLLTLIPMAQFIGSLFKSQLICLQVMAFSTYPIFLITGYTWPYESLPLPLQWISSLLPTTPFIKIYTAIVQAGASITTDLGTLFHLILLWLLYSILAYYRIHIISKKAVKELPSQQQVPVQ
ncbi:ABC transporter permease [Pedobacter sp.]|jgi:ABC-2 type transport system permease protein|uniref:ABC transporter permease n=1 Tax=Pedobacter sp. TaxID=1411316 RepID=UPI002B9EF029|nr:ABC transporter permease [Pedobacter sp.]HWW40952.1 ABC transporter permease [Pedobacter sp.]